MSDMTRAEWENWIATRPKQIQDLAQEFPWGMRIVSPDVTLFVIGWDDRDALVVSKVDPRSDYEEAKENTRVLKAKFLRDAGFVGARPQ